VVVCEDEDFDEVSDWIASSADAAAPRAKNMTELQPMPRDAAMRSHTEISKRRAIAKNSTKHGFMQPEPSAWPGN
jgi:hypothetical protein